MKLSDILSAPLSESERSDYVGQDQEDRKHEELGQIWQDDYSYFYEEVGGLVNELDDMYPDNPRAKEAKEFFSKKFNGMDSAKVNDSDASHINRVISKVLEDTDPSFDDVISKLNMFVKELGKVDVYYSVDDIYDVETSNRDYQIGSSYDEYDDKGVSRSDF